MTTEHNDIQDIIVDLLTGELNDETRTHLQEWLAKSPDNEKRLQNYRELWIATHNEHYDVEAALKRFQRNMPKMEERRKAMYQEQKRHRTRNTMRWAAVILLPIFIAGTIFIHIKPKDVSNAAVRYATIEGQQSTFLLPDGTTVEMKERSSLSYSQSDFTKGKRKVTFEGEAYFTVEADSLHPFDILTNSEQVHVTGTKFELSSRPEDTYNMLTLDKGIVTYTNLKTNQTAVMREGEVLTVENASGRNFQRMRGLIELEKGGVYTAQDAELRRVTNGEGQRDYYVHVNQPIQPGAYKINLHEETNALDLAKTNINSPFQAGDGTKEHPYVITNAYQLCNMKQALVPRQMVYFELSSDINMKGIKWIPLNDMEDNYAYWINFNGRGHVIRNLSPAVGAYYSSFFGVLCGECRNVGFDNAVIVSSDRGAGVLGSFIGHHTYPDTTIIEDCFFTGHVDSRCYAGGIGGVVDGKTAIRRCASSVNVSSLNGHAGGLVARVKGELIIEHSFVDGAVTGQETGGIFATRYDETCTVPLHFNGVVTASPSVCGNTQALAIGHILPNDEMRDVHHLNSLRINGKIETGGEPPSQIKARVRQWPNTWYLDGTDLQ